VQHPKKRVGATEEIEKSNKGRERGLSGFIVNWGNGSLNTTKQNIDMTVVLEQAAITRGYMRWVMWIENLRKKKK